MAKDTLWEAYNAGARNGDYRSKTRNSFGREIKKLRPDLFNDRTEAQRTIAGSLKWVWTGVGLEDKGRS